MWVRASTPHGVAVKSGASWPGMDRRARRQNIMSNVRTLARPAELDAAGAALARAGADQLQPGSILLRTADMPTRNRQSGVAAEALVPAILHGPGLPDRIAALEVPFALSLRRPSWCGFGSAGRGPRENRLLPGEPATLALRATGPLRPGFGLQPAHCCGRRQARGCFGKGSGNEDGSNRQGHDPWLHARSISASRARNKSPGARNPKCARPCPQSDGELQVQKGH
jgi:hypothetical protein